MDIMAVLLLLVIFLTAMGTKMLQSVIMLKLVDTNQKGKAMLLSVLIPSLMLALVSSVTISKRMGPIIFRLMRMPLPGNRQMGPYL